MQCKSEALLLLTTPSFLTVPGARQGSRRLKAGVLAPPAGRLPSRRGAARTRSRRRSTPRTECSKKTDAPAPVRSSLKMNGDDGTQCGSKQSARQTGRSVNRRAARTDGYGGSAAQGQEKLAVAQIDAAAAGLLHCGSVAVAAVAAEPGCRQAKQQPFLRRRAN